MAGEEPWSVTIKVALYLFDLISDWVNGGLMIHGGPPGSLTEDGLKPSCGPLVTRLTMLGALLRLLCHGYQPSCHWRILPR